MSADLLTAWASAKAGIGQSTASLTQDPNAPLAPVWTPGVSPSAEALIQRAITNKPFFDLGAKLYSDLGATGDYKRLFALYSGLTTLQALAGRAEDASLDKRQQAQTLAQFARGLTELQSFFAQQQFDDIRLAQADRVDNAQTTLALPMKNEDYTTGVIHRGGLYDKVSGLAEDAKFEIVATSGAGTERRVMIDLAQMGSIPRTLGNVVSFINGRLSAAGAASRIETVDQTPKQNTIVIAGQTHTTRYTGPKQYALKVDVRAGEKVAFEPVAAQPAFYAVGDVAGGARLIKLQDTGDVAGQPVWLTRPDATDDPIGAYVSTGFLGAGFEQRSNALMSASDGNKFETALRAAGEAVLKLQFADGRTLSVSTGWRAGDQEAWLGTDDGAIMADLAERLSQLLHEQGVAAKVVAWEEDGAHGLSVLSDDLVGASQLSIGGHNVAFEAIDPPGMLGGLRDGVFARRFEAGAVAGADELFIGKQVFTVTAGGVAQAITIDGGEDGIDATELAEKLNEQLRAKNIAAAAYLIEEGGALNLRFDALHEVTAISARVNGAAHAGAMTAPGAWANGGLPAAAPGQPFSENLRTQTAASSPLLTHAGALDIQIVVATPSGNRTISVAVSAQERLDNPDIGAGQWNAAFQARLDEALNAAGVYVSGSDDLRSWTAAEGAGHRVVSVSVNGDALALQADAPALGVGGAFSPERSFTGAQAAGAADEEIAALVSNPNVSITLDTVWGPRTISASLEPGDPRTLESAALRLNERLAALGYDAGVGATELSGGGASVRIVTGSSHSVRGVSALNLGDVSHNLTLDPIDAMTYGANPPGALRAAERAARGAAIIETVPAGVSLTAPSAAASNWFPGRAFDVSIGGGAKVATAQAVATGADGAVYVLADLSGDSADTAIKGARDVALLKYDSAGKLVFTQMLGASESASGFALAVSADGKVAVAGAVEGALSNATAARGGQDSFVTLFDANGKELWTQRRAASGDDSVNAVAFAPDGSVIVAGQTESALGAALAAGGVDGYVRGFSASGGELFTRQFGTGGADSATALLVRDNGAGGFEIFTGGVENNRGIIRSFAYAAGVGFSAGATRDIGYFHNGAINTIAADGASLYVGGAIGADRLTLGAPAHGAVAGQEGFVARLDADLVSTGLDRASYIGSSKDDAVQSIAIVNGDVYAAGMAGGIVAGVGNSNASSSFLARLDDEGALAWARAFTSAGGAMALNSLAVDTGGVSPLDVLGLPRGVVAANESTALVARSALRVGDELQIGADGRRLTTIRIGADDTLASLAASINRVIGSAGRAEIVRENGIERLNIRAFSGKAVRLEAGRAGRDALAGLGLGPGVIAENISGRNSVRNFGLGLIAADLKLDTPEAIKATKAELSAAISIVRQAYEHLLNPNAKPKTAEEEALEQRRLAGGAVPEYYSKQLANYQAALARLTGG
ncbi:MAG TPA: hypothetical protein PLK37_01020 [Terricaulis sp.]|nr:hypothetical protein [Terricaulis sp.]